MTEKGLKKSWYLRKINIFAGLSEKEMDYINQSTGMKTYKKNELIHFTEDSREKIFFLKKGKVKLLKSDPSGKEITYALLKAHEIFGNLSPSPQSDSSEFAQVVEDALVCEIDKNLFNRFIESQPPVALQINKLLSRKVYELELLIEELTFKSVYQRLASLLLKLDEQFGFDHTEGRMLNVKLTHADLASMIGATRESATIAFNNLKKQHLVNSKWKKIVITDIDNLKKINKL